MRNPIFNGFQSGLDNATAQYNPQPNYGITPLPPITLDPGMGEGPFSEANPQTDSGFISLLQGLKTQNDGEIQRKQTELQATRDKFVTFARQMAMEEFNAPQKQQIGQQEAMTAGILALVAKLAGARDQYIQGGLGGYLEGRETQNVNQYNQDLQASKQDYQQRINGLQTESDIAQMDMKGIQGEIGNLQDYGGKLVGEMGDAYNRETIAATEAAKIASREKIATDNATAALARIGAQNQGRLNVEQFKANNPQVMQIYNAIFSTAGPEAANRYMNDFASTPGFKNQLTKAQVSNTEARTATEKVRKDKILEEIRLMPMKEERMRGELALKVKKHADSIDTDAEELAYKRAIGLIDSDIATLKADITTHKDLAKLSKSLMDNYEIEMKAASPGSTEHRIAKQGFDKAKADYDRATNAVIDGLKKVAEKTKMAKQEKSSNGNAPFNPLIDGNTATLRGKI